MAARLRSLDAFRGATIAGMILVNNPGSWSHIHPPLAHAAWHGWTPTDLIFPFFLFIAGVSLTFSFARRRAEGAGTPELLSKIWVRAAIIFGLGLILNLIPAFDLATVRIPGVLQRIAVVYAIAASLSVLLPPRALYWIAALLLVGYWAVMMLVPVPGHGSGVLDPIGNLAQHIDARLLAGHMWKPEWDPEGILSTIPAIATCLLGIFAGRWLQAPRMPAEHVAGMFVWGSAGVVAGWIWSGWFPINKSLWTSSYVLFTGGLAAMGLAACYWVVDVHRRDRWARPFFVFGTNALAAFVLSGLMARILVWWKVPHDGTMVAVKTRLYDALAARMSPPDASLAFAAGYVLLWLGLMAILHRRGWHLRV
jgi:predicted acyltransferase